MEIKIHREAAEAMKAGLKPFGIDPESERWTKLFFINLHSLNKEAAGKLRALLSKHVEAKGVKIALADMTLWDKAVATGGANVVPRTVKQFETMLRVYLSAAPRHHVYRKAANGIWDCYYVTHTKFHKEEVHGRGEERHVTPAHASIGMTYNELGGQRNTSETWWPGDIFEKTVPQAMAASGLYIETPELRAEYLARINAWKQRFGRIGLQFHATGLAEQLYDDGARHSRSRSWWDRSTQVVMDRGGEPGRVVIDVLSEGEDDDARTSKGTTVNKMWWATKKVASRSDDEEDTEDIASAPDEDEVPEPEIPISPMLVCYDLKRHVRVTLDSAQLTPYKYDNRLNDKLILPEDSRNLVEMLLGHKSQFKDIVHGKSGGAIILCAGIPGTGKTLTAEVYAEVMSRPLYTVQASQLGTDPDALEAELLKTFARAQRWNAILLLDEADVYVRARGDDLTQNAIVGVFLRVLEYYRGVLFLTTNRYDLVDDAISSRCIARINYMAPAVEDQKRIWRVLASSAGIEMSDEVINEVATRYPDLTGRDVKNLLKLAKLVSDTRECPINLDVIRFVKRFKPTVGTEREREDNEPVHLPPMPERPDLPEPAPEPEPVVEAEQPKQEDAAGATLEAKSSPTSTQTTDWRSAVTAVFEDGAPHPASEAKEAVAKVAPTVHPNAVTNVINSLAKAGRLVRLASGLYRKEV